MGQSLCSVPYFGMVLLMSTESGCMQAGKGWRGEALLTAELRLRPAQESDIPILAHIANDPDIAKMTAVLPHPYGEEDARRFVAQAALDREQGKEITLIMERLADGQLAGAVSLALENEQGRIGYWIAKPHWKRGYATQAVRRMTRLAFQALALENVCAHVMKENPASVRVLEKAGFSEQATSSCFLPGRCKDADVLLFGQDRKTWLHLQTAKPLLLVVAAALIDADSRVLLTCRPKGKMMEGLWEFPGGKVHAGESPEAALLRELKEELGIDAKESCLAPLAFASHDYDSFHLLMPLFVLRQWQGAPTPHEGQRLAWVRKDLFSGYPMPPADLPLVPLLSEWI
jgi:8-oxo-dGTP diphosphatase